MKEPKCILITGASSGIGKSLALEYAKDGVKLFLLGRNLERLDEVKKACEAKGASVKTSTINICDSNYLKEWILEQDNSQNIDLVIANAGISGGTGGHQDNSSGESEQQVQSIFNVNVTGVLNTILPIIPNMVKRKRGQIAIMSSMASFRALPGAPSYSASKASVRYYGEALRGSLAKENVEVSVICPGYVKTPMTDVNEFPMPFIISPEKAAKIIVKGLSNNRGRIAFPLPMYWIMLFIGILPNWLTDPLFTRLPKKS